MLSLLFLALLFTSNEAASVGIDPFANDEAGRQTLNKKALDYHNYMRSKAAVGVVTAHSGNQPTGSDIVNLVWSDALATIAQDYAEKCDYVHNPKRADEAYADRLNMPFAMDKTTQSVGENIGYSTVEDATLVTMDGLQTMWEEANRYEFPPTDQCNGDEPCKHYTQMAWSTSRYIGCGVARCTELDHTEAGHGTFFVCNYYPAGNININNKLTDIYNTEDNPCDNCPWDKTRCDYDASVTYTYDPDWRNMPADVYTDVPGLCIGCGNKYFEQCARGKNLKENCIESNINTAGCGAQASDSSVCDTAGDEENGIPEADTCQVNDYCRYWCGFCHCSIPDADVRDYDKFNTCDATTDGCDDGLGRTFTGGCYNDEAVATYWDAWCDANAVQGPDSNGAGSKADSKVNFCFSSDQWVFTEGYKKKMLGEVELGEKMLVYDELNDEFVWDDLMVKLHFGNGEFLNDELIEMIEFVLENNETLTMTGNHLLYVGNDGLRTAESVQIGDVLKRFDGRVRVVRINNVMKYPRNLISYNGNLVINGIAVSTWTDSIFGESEYWGKSVRWVMKNFYKRNVWRYPAYYVAKMWNEWLSFNARESVLQFYFTKNERSNDDKMSSCWYSSVVGSF